MILKDGKSTKTVTLNKPNTGLLIVNGIWRELQNFSSGAVCLVLALQNLTKIIILGNTKSSGYLKTEEPKPKCANFSLIKINNLNV